MKNISDPVRVWSIVAVGISGDQRAAAKTRTAFPNDRAERLASGILGPKKDVIGIEQQSMHSAICTNAPRRNAT